MKLLHLPNHLYLPALKTASRDEFFFLSSAQKQNPYINEIGIQE